MLGPVGMLGCLVESKIWFSCVFQLMRHVVHQFADVSMNVLYIGLLHDTDGLFALEHGI